MRALEQLVELLAGEFGSGEEVARQVPECTFGMVRVLTWNLMHGRAVPSAGRELFEEFASALQSWEWDVALLQEVPPWWPPPLAARLGAVEWTVLTSRNSLLALRRAVARRWPDLIKSNGGGANAILVRGGDVVEHRRRRLSVWPERRWVHAVRLDDGLWIANTHCSGDVRQAWEGAAFALRWANGAPAIVGGDWNVPASILEEALAREASTRGRLSLAGASGVDQVFVAGLSVSAEPRVLERGRLSDHAPLLVSVMEIADHGGQTHHAP